MWHTIYFHLSQPKWNCILIRHGLKSLGESKEIFDTDIWSRNQFFDKHVIHTSGMRKCSNHFVLEITSLLNK